MLGFSPLAGAALASTGDASQSVTVSISNSSGIVRSETNLSTPMFRGAVGFEPEETLFEVVVNGRILGDIDNNVSFNTNDVINALQWENSASSAAVTAYIEGPMTTYMLANQAAYEGINIAFSNAALEMSGAVGSVTTSDYVSVDVSGVSGTGQVGIIDGEGNAVAYPLGLGSIGSVGETVAIASAESIVSGDTADGEVGDAEVKTTANLSVSGAAAVSAVGTISTKISVSVQVTGLSSQCLQGSVLVWGRIVPENLANWVEVEPVEVDPWTQIPAQSSAAFQPLVPNAGTGYTEIKPAPDTVWEKVAA